MHQPSVCDFYHGNDGFGDVTLDGTDPIDANSITQEHAAAAICRLVAEQPGDLTYLYDSNSNYRSSTVLDVAFHVLVNVLTRVVIRLCNKFEAQQHAIG